MMTASGNFLGDYWLDKDSWIKSKDTEANRAQKNCQSHASTGASWQRQGAWHNVNLT
jgi:hypothetical protein